MRVPPPGLLKLDRNALLRDVREQLGERIPAYANAENDPTDPGWLILEQAAWMAEILSDQLDRYPFAVVQHFVHMMGGHLRPAQPSLGVIVAEVAVGGRLEHSPTRTSPWRFFTPQSEELRALEFVPVESGVDLRKAQITTYCELYNGALTNAGEREARTGSGAQIAWRTRPRRSGIFDYEMVHFTIVRNKVEDLLEPLDLALEQLEKRNIGWLQLTREQEAHDRLRVTARVDIAAAFESVAPGGLAPGGDLHVDWGTLDGVAWTPPVVISNHPQLANNIRGGQPMPGDVDGKILIPGVPEHFPISQLLIRRPSPIPQQVVDAIWTTLTNINSDLRSLSPIITRDFHPQAFEEKNEPTWVSSALEGDVWADLRQGDRTAVHVVLAENERRTGSIRIALILDLDDPEADDTVSRCRAYGIEADGKMSGRPIPLTLAWRMPLPPQDDRPNMVTVAALDLELDEDDAGVLLSVEGRMVGALVNALAVANLPAVRDGREKTVQRNVPEAISLLNGDVVSPRVMDQLLEQPIPSDAAEMLKQLPLAYFTSRQGDTFWNWKGMGIDPSEGTIVLNAPDERGDKRVIRPGTRVKLNWYRRTDGEVANVDAGMIRLLEQEPSAVPTLFSVSNPLPSSYGAARETPEAATDRLFAPAGGVPVLPSDYERVVRLALGQRGQRWKIRCWAYAERALVSTALWPFDGVEVPDDSASRKAVEAARAERARLEVALAEADPSLLLVALGGDDEPLTEQELDWARRVVKQAIRQLSRRLPTMRSALITRLYDLSYQVDVPHRDTVLPCYNLRHLQRGVLVDSDGLRAKAPQSLLLLNAAATRVEGEGRGF